MPKGQDQGGAFVRLRRRIDNYRKHHVEVGPRHDNTTANQNQQQKQDTLLLRQRFLETNKAKKSAKKSDKKQHSDIGGSSVGPGKSNKRQNEDDQGGAEGYEPPSKIGAAGRGTSSPLPSNSTNSSLYKQGFSQNGKRGNSKAKALDSQKYPSSSSNHPKNGIGRVPPGPLPPNASFPQCTNAQSNAPVSEFKKDSLPSNLLDFADLDQCAAALEKDAAKNGAIAGSFMGESSTDEIFNSDVLNDLISEISDLNPEVMSNFYLDDGPPPTADDLNDVTLHGTGTSANGTCNTTDSFHPVTPVTPTTASPMRSSTVTHGHLSGIKMEGSGAGVDGTTLGVHGMDRGLSHCAGPSPAPASTASPLASQLGSSSHQPSPSQSYNNSHYVLDNGQTGSPINATGVVNSCNTGSSMAKPSTRLPYSSPAGISVDSPAAQTLKHMAEQHQHKAQMHMSSTSATNGAVPFKNQGSVGSPAGSPYGMGTYNGVMPTEFSGQAGGMNPGSNCQVKQEVCSPGNPQAGFSPSPMMVDMSAGVKRPGQHNGSSPSGQSSRIPNMSSAGGSPIMSPISKSFNHPHSSPLSTANSQQQPQPSQPPYMPMNRLQGPSQPYTNATPRFSSANNSQISVASPKSVGSSQGHVSDRGSPATQMDTKPQLRLGVPNPNLQQQHQQQQQFAQQQYHYTGGQNSNMPVEMGFNPNGHPQNSQMPQSQQQSGSGQTINFTQQHLRMGGPSGMPPSRMPMPGMNRMPTVPQRMPGGPMPGGPIPEMQQQQPPPQQQLQQQQQQPQQQQRPMMDTNQHPQQQRVMRPPPQAQHPRHNMMPPHQQMPMGGLPVQQQQGMQQMTGGPGMGPSQMANRFAGMPNNPQMMPQQQAYNMGGNMPMTGPNSGMMPMRRPYGAGPSYQGMGSRGPGEQVHPAGSHHPHASMGNQGVPHGDWMGNMNNMSDGSCPPYSGPMRHPPQQQMRPAMPPQQYHSGMPPNQGNSEMKHPGASQLPGNFNQPHDHMISQQNANFNMGVAAQNHSQQQQLHHHPQQPSQQLPPNFNPHAANANSMKMGLPPGHHPQQQQQQQQMYGNANNGFGMKPPEANMMCPPQNPMSHHQQMQQHPSQQPHHNMYNMSGNNMMNPGGGPVGMSDQQEFNLDLLVDGMRGGGDHVDTSAFNDTDELLNTLGAVFP